MLNLVTSSGGAGAHPGTGGRRAALMHERDMVERRRNEAKLWREGFVALQLA